MRFNVSPSLMLLLAFATFCNTPAASAVPQDGNDDGALFLTPMIRAGRINEARVACKVKSLDTAVESYSGYLTVNEVHGSNLFFWFFPAMNAPATAPVLLWLQGGPGTSSLYALFNEHGPFSVHKNGSGLRPRKHTWVTTHSVLYVDNPVGTGYSFTADDAGYSTDQTTVGHNMYEALVQFFALFSEYRKNDFYVTGESYAGKYVPAVSYTIHLKNPGAAVKINLKGLAIGNGLIDPVNQLVHGEYLYQNALIDEDGKRKMEKLQNLARGQILDGDYGSAFRTFADMVLMSDNYHPYPSSLFTNLTGMQYYFNMLWDRDPEPYGDWQKYVQEPSARAALHVGQRPLNNGSLVELRLENDVMQSVATWLAFLLDTGRYRVLLYSGQMDIIVPYPGTVRLSRALEWSGAERFRNATRTIWRVPSNDKSTVSEVAGYAASSGPLTVVLVRDAGHMVPGDQPVWGLDLINRFTTGKPF